MDGPMLRPGRPGLSYYMSSRTGVGLVVWMRMIAKSYVHGRMRRKREVEYK